ncbi:P-loop NTPase [Candidatus Fermentibacteria bacterium]|nr:P-loop NTPase [Candidatus Fermentibacteria bacterium]
MEDGEVVHVTATVIEHAQRPRNYGKPLLSNGHARITGECGDTMEMWVMVRDDVVERATFTTDGCAPSLACGSMATTLAEGKSLEDAASITQSDIIQALGGLPDEVGHCAALAAATLRAACENYAKAAAQRHEPPPSSAAGAQCSSCTDRSCSAQTRRPDESDEEFAQRQALQQRLCRIRHKIVVLSGKGGVGKSTVAVNLAVGLAKNGNSVGLLDVDFHGPSVPTMLGLEGEKPYAQNGELLPVSRDGLKVLSLGFFLESADDAVIWRGPMKMGVIRQLLKDAAWGDLDFLIIDSPPGTGDEPLSVFQLLGTVDGAVIVTTPQRVAEIDVRKSVTFCRKLGAPILGIVENMGSFACPHCGTITSILQEGAGQRIAKDMQIPFLGSIPIDPRVAELADSGIPIIEAHDSASASIMQHIVDEIGRRLST